MSFILNNIENKLKKSVICDTVYKSKKCLEDPKLSIISSSIDSKFLLIVKSLFFNFLIFFSKNLRNKKKNIKNLLVFLKFYGYYNSFFFNNKVFFYKKYFSKKNYNLFYFEKFFLSTKNVRLNPCLHRLKAKKIAFYKKYIWNANRRFRKKNILIFNKKFFKFYTSNRFNPYIVDSLLDLLNIKKQKHTRFFRKKFFGLLHKKYYYLFLHKHHIFSRPRKKYYKKKIISYNFRYRTYPKIFVNRKFFAHRRRRVWRRVYYTRKRRRFFIRMLFTSFVSKSFDNTFLSLNKNTKKRNVVVLGKYMGEYGAKLEKKHFKEKNFMLKFCSRRRSFRRFKNILYYFKWKPKLFDFHFFGIFKNNKNIKKILFSAVWFKFFYKKIFWRKKKYSKTFLLFYYKYFFLNKTFLLFNSFLKSNFCFLKNKQWKKRRRLNIRRRRNTIYLKRIRRRVIQLKVKRKFMRFFIIFFFFKLMKKHKKAEKIFLLKNSLFLSNLKKIKLCLLTKILLGNDPIYFKDNSVKNVYSYTPKKDIRLILLLKKNNF